MNLPRLTADLAVGPPPDLYRARGPRGRSVSIKPQATISCLSDCVGDPAASKCSAECGSTLACWQTCAGITDTSCVAACYKS